MTSLYNATPEADLVGTFKGTKFAVKHVHEVQMLDQHNLVLLVQQANGDWMRRSVILMDMKESDVIAVGVIAFLVAALVAINQALKLHFGDPGQEDGPPPEPADIWAAMDQALHDGFEYRITETGVEMRKKAS